MYVNLPNVISCHCTIALTRATICILQSTGKTALFFASEKGHLDVVELLLKYKADTTIQDNASCPSTLSLEKRPYLEIVVSLSLFKISILYIIIISYTKSFMYGYLSVNHKLLS